MTLPPVPHPERPAVDAGAAAFLDAAAKARNIPPSQRPTFASLDPSQKLTARQWALDVLTPATPLLAAQVARALAADLDGAGHTEAATRLHAVAGAWTAASPAGDPFAGLW